MALRQRLRAAIDNLMEDAATAEISRSQVWQWVFNEATLDTGETVTRELVERIVEEEYAALAAQADDTEHLDEGRWVFVETALGTDYPDFLTLPAYRACWPPSATTTGDEMTGLECV